MQVDKKGHFGPSHWGLSRRGPCVAESMRPLFITRVRDGSAKTRTVGVITAIIVGWFHGSCGRDSSLW